MTAVRDALRKARRSAVHLEMRDSYGRDNPEFEAWLAGEPRELARWTGEWQPWLDLIAETVGRGVEVRRVRIVSEPISDYIRFEYDGTHINLSAGEHVRWLPRRQATDIALPGNDYWLFDEEAVIVNHFDGDGRGLDFEIVTDPGLARLCASAFETVWQRAIPHEKYQP